MTQDELLAQLNGFDLNNLINTNLDVNQGTTTLADSLSSFGNNNFSNPNIGTPKDSSKSFNWTGQGGANVAAGVQGAGALLNALAAFQQYKLGKDVLKQNKTAFNTNLANQATITNARIQDRALQRAAQRSDLAGNFDAMREAADKEFQARKVSGTPI